MRAYLELVLGIDEYEIQPLENLKLFSLSTGTTISSSTSIDQTYIDSNPGHYTIEGWTVENPVTISIVSNLTITSIDTYFIINSDYITIYSDTEQGYIININDVLLYGGLVLNSINSNILIDGITIKGSNSTLNPGAGWIAGASFGVNSSNILIQNCSNYLPIAINSGGIVGSNSFVFTSLCNNYGELLVNPNILSNGNYDASRSGGIYGKLSKGNCDKCTNYGEINGTVSGGIVATTNQTFNITNCKNNGIINGFASAGIIATVYQNTTLDNTLNIENCLNSVYGNINGSNSAGIIYSNFNVITSIINCENDAIMSNVCSGIINQISSLNEENPNNYTLIKSCTNYGNLNGSYTGGIIRSSKLVNIESCTNYGNIEGGFNSGGIVSSFSQTTTNILSCSNNGNVSGVLVGGIFGPSCEGTANNCSNDGEISGKDAGGIVGQDSLVNLTDCTNSGNITGEGAGGIYGAGCGESVILENCINNGEVSGNNSGGIFGSWCAGTAQNCTNAGSITGISAGGIYGEFSTGTSVNSINNGNLYGVNTRSI